MQNKDSDTFEFNNNNNNRKLNNLLSDNKKNPFANSAETTQHFNRLNDYDYNILQDGAYKNITDDAFKLEYKISKTEEDIEAIKSQICTAQEIGDYDKLTQLQYELKVKKDTYQSLLDMYNQTTLSAKILDSFSNFIERFFGKNLSGIKFKMEHAAAILLSKMPVKMVSMLKIKQSLQLLENINKNVDSLIATTIPYGENRNKYSLLSEYIIKSNSIQAEISDYLKK